MLIECVSFINCELTVGSLLPLHSPTIVEEPVVEIEAGRHPIIHSLLGEGEQYVPNDTKLSVCTQYSYTVHIYSTCTIYISEDYII